MPDRVIADLIVVVHLLFVAFVVAGGILVLRAASARLAAPAGGRLGRVRRILGDDLPADAAGEPLPAAGGPRRLRRRLRRAIPDARAVPRGTHAAASGLAGRGRRRRQCDRLRARCSCARAGDALPSPSLRAPPRRPRAPPHDDALPRHRPALRHRDPADAPRCAPRWRRRRWATTSTARTRPSTSCRRASRRCSARRPRCSCRSGTMANQVALQGAHAAGRRRDRQPREPRGVARGRRAAANAGVQFTEVGHGGLFTCRRLRWPRSSRAGHAIFPPTTLVEIENTHNRGGGARRAAGRTSTRICAAARERGIASYLDGARLWNAAVASGATPSALAAPFDLVGVALSKGLGAPVGSRARGPARATSTARQRYRRMLGGAMRQSGIVAAAGIYAPDHHVARLADDHANARLIGDRLAQCPRRPARPRDRRNQHRRVPARRRRAGRRDAWSRGRASAAC